MRESADLWLGIMKSEGLGFAGQLFKGTLWGFLGGIVLSLVAVALLKRFGLLSPARSRATRWGTRLFYLALLPVCTGFIGFNQGALTGANRFVSEGPFAKEIMPVVGDGMAEAVLVLDAVLSGTSVSNALQVAVKTPGLNVATFSKNLKDSSEDLIEQALAGATQPILNKYPTLREGAGNTIFLWLLNTFGDQLFIAVAKGQSDRLGLRKPVRVWFEGLPGATGADADGLLSREGLAHYSASTIARHFVLQPFSAGFKLQKSLGWIAAGCVVIVPVLFLRLSRKSSSSPPPPPPPLRDGQAPQ